MEHHQLPKTSLLFFSLIFLLLITGCSDKEEPEPKLEFIVLGTTPSSELADHRALWQNAGIRQYQFTYHQSCFCPPEENILISVENNVIVSAIYEMSGEEVGEPRRQYLLTIDQLFDEIQNAIDDEVYHLDVSYDSHFGYPTRIAIDQDLMMADEEVIHFIVDFQ